MLEYIVDTNTTNEAAGSQPEAVEAVAGQSIEAMLDQYDDLCNDLYTLERHWARGVDRYSKHLAAGHEKRAGEIREFNLNLSIKINDSTARLLILKEAILAKMKSEDLSVKTKLRAGFATGEAAKAI